MIRTRAKVLSGYEDTDDEWKKIFQSAVSRDNLWVTRDERKSIAESGQIPRSLKHRIARFHLVDNTRGEPPMWRPEDVREINLRLTGTAVTGNVKLISRDGSRSYNADLRGIVEVADGQVTRFDMVANGRFRGEGRYTRDSPKGEFPLAVAFSLADGTETADGIPPQGSRGWIDGYLND